MKKILMLATAAFLISGVAFADCGDKKDCGKDKKTECKSKDKSCCKKDAKKETKKESKTEAKKA
jgi:hypothetical protein